MKIKSIIKKYIPKSLTYDIRYLYKINELTKKRNREFKRKGIDGLEYKYTLRDFYENNCIFVHIPRAAGNSISNSLFGHCGGGHKSIRDYRKIFGPWFHFYYKFTFVRNPFARLVSAYDYLKKGGHPAWPSNRRFAKQVIASYTGFSEFVLQWLRPDRSDFPLPHFYPQTFFLELDGELTVDFIGSVESIKKDFDIVCRELGKGNSLHRENEAPGERKPLSAFYTKDSVIRRVQEVYKSDFGKLGYPRNLERAEQPPVN